MTIHDAAAATGWSPRMLRYVETVGLVTPDRSQSGYRLYGERQVERLRALRVLVERHGVEIQDAGFALRLTRDATLRSAIDAWLGEGAEATGVSPDGTAARWLRYEQDKHQKLLTGTRVTVLHDKESA